MGAHHVGTLEGSSDAIAKRLLAEYGVVTVPSEGFGPGGDGHLRLSFATGLDRHEAMVRDELG